MARPSVYIAASPALDCAKVHLKKMGISITDSISQNTSHILLPIPTKELPGWLPEGCTVIGGNLPCGGIDLLKDPIYLAQNAAITAHGAIKVAMNAAKCCLWDCRTLILGWGRIAQCLAHLLKGLGVDVTVAARREEAVALAGALGFDASLLQGLDYRNYNLVFNTIPGELGLQEGDFSPRCAKIDLASQPVLPGADVIWARGLPGKETPESSGQLIASRVAYNLNKE